MTETIFSVETFLGRRKKTLRYGMLRSVTPLENPRPIIYVPGLGGSVKMALNFLRPFAAHIGPVYSLDAPGIGLNEDSPHSLLPGAYLKELTVFIQQLTAEGKLSHAMQPPILMGISLGAAYSTLFSVQYPTLFAGLILLAPAYYPHPERFTVSYRWHNYWRLLLKGPFAITELPYGIPDLTRNVETYMSSVSDPHAKLGMPLFYLYLVDQLCRKAAAKVPKIMLPTAMIIPGSDRVCHPDGMRQMYDQMKNPKNQLLYYPELFHDVVQEPQVDLDQIYTDLKCWIAGLAVDESRITPISVLSPA